MPAAPDPQGPIGVFDSGIGGLSILRAVRAALPHEDLVYAADTAHAPYGERDAGFVQARSLAIAHELVHGHGAKLLVVACNTATALAVETLRAAFADLPVVGVEPPLKPAAALTRTGRVAVLATRGTLHSPRFAQLHARLRGTVHFHLQPCDGLAAAIEAANAREIEALIAKFIRLAGPFGTRPGESDTLVLGCTHYPLCAPLMQRHAGDAVHLLEPGLPVARQAAALLAQRALARAPTTVPGRLHLWATQQQDALHAAATRWILGSAS